MKQLCKHPNYRREAKKAHKRRKRRKKELLILATHQECDCLTINFLLGFFGKKRYFAEITSFHWGYKTTLRIAWEMQHANQICIHWKYLLVFLKEKNLEGRTKKMLIEKHYCARNARLMRGCEGTRFSWQRIVVAIYFKSPCDSSASSISSISSASGPPVWPEPSLPSS